MCIPCCFRHQNTPRSHFISAKDDSSNLMYASTTLILVLLICGSHNSFIRKWTIQFCIFTKGFWKLHDHKNVCVSVISRKLCKFTDRIFSVSDETVLLWGEQDWVFLLISAATRCHCVDEKRPFFPFFSFFFHLI